MTDERHPGTGDDAEGDERPDAPEPEFGSSEWLLQQLTGGRRIASSPSEQPGAEQRTAPDAGAGAPELGAPDAGAAQGQDVAESAAPAAALPVVPEAGPTEERQSETAEPTPTTALPVTNADDTFELFLTPQDEDAERAQAAPASEAEEDTEQAQGFSWNLTPGVGSDPLVDEPAEPASGTVWHLDDTTAGSAEVDATAGSADSAAAAGFTENAAAQPDAPAAPSAPVAPPVPPVIPVPSFDSYESTSSRAADEESLPAGETAAAPVEPAHREPTPPDTTTFEPPSFFEALRLPEPPVWNIDAEPAAETGPTTPPLFTPPPAEPFVAEPVVDAHEPEPPAPEQDDREAEGESHGLAALLGFFGEDDTEEPASTSRSVIGDTTGIIPLPPGALTPPAAPAAPAAQPAPATPPGPVVPPVPVVPASPVLPPPDASALFEPGTRSGQSTADVPTTRLDTEEIAALLRARPGDPEPVAYDARPEPDGRTEPTASAESTGSTPAVPPAATVPPIEEATLLLGALPSPATQPLDAESIGVASEPTAAIDLSGTRPDTAASTEVEPGVPGEPPAGASETPTAATILFPELASPATAETIELVPPVAPATPAPATAQAPRTPTGSHAATIPAPGAPAAAPTGAGAGAGAGGGAPTDHDGGRSRRTNRILFWVAGGLAVVLVLIGLFALGTRVPDMFGAAQPSAAPSASTPPPSATPTPTPTPTIQAKPAGPVAAGTHPWNTLGGGECIQPYTSPWAETFAVVDCASPHTAQLVYTNLFSADLAAPYPGADALAGQINAVCTQPGIIDLAAAAAYPDLQLQGTFPATEQQWKDGQRSFYCFVSRSGGEPLTSTVAGPGPAA